LTAGGIGVIGGKINLGGPVQPNYDGTVGEVSVYNVELTAAQVLAHYSAGTKPNSGQTTGIRIGAYLDAVAWAASLRRIDTGQITVQAADQTAVINSGLANMQVTADTELGELFIDAAGTSSSTTRRRSIGYLPTRPP